MLAAGLSKLTPLAYNYLFGVALFDAIIVWIIILLSHLSFRRRRAGADLPVRMPGFPVVQIAGLALLSAVLVTMGLDKRAGASRGLSASPGSRSSARRTSPSSSHGRAV